MAPVRFNISSQQNRGKVLQKPGWPLEKNGFEKNPPRGEIRLAHFFGRPELFSPRKPDFFFRRPRFPYFSMKSRDGAGQQKSVNGLAKNTAWGTYLSNSQN